ncbi:CGNR zinc finger domain-containing protein [Nocardia spumae]|uniref:CGNR zinc finger domain-containing protein n=1 Tax=Nocardia spumae TaxID=2887190 RepID=UPI001D143C0B|nr:CGNR zinc finger domain-containing protein [Nocardia spumae]
MQTRATLPPDVRRRFRSGRAALDFVHTGGDGELASWEIVHTVDDLRRWVSFVLGLEDLTAASSDLPAMRAVRTAITHAAYGLAAGDPVRPDDIAILNAAAAEPPLVPVLGPGLTLEYAAPTTRAALSTLARDAIDLFTGPLAGRIRVCAAEDCGLLFVDTSRPGRRRWCSMERCGNLAKIRKYRDT